MAIDGRILARAKAALEERRKLREDNHIHRKQKVYAKTPRIRELDAELRATMAELIGFALGMDAAGRVEEIREKNLNLQDERRSLLVRAGFSADYLDDNYMCNRCRDTGYHDTKMCVCLMELYKEEQRESLSSLLKLGDETFDNFDLTLYDDTPASDTGISPRQSMEIVYEICIEYARKFGSKSMNLFFNGAPGLGKTFLSACIARVVADKGFSVVYDMATSIFSKFEDVKFMRSSDSEELRAEVRKSREDIKRYLECDLLIIDDLGTEMTTSFTISALYEVVNTRLITDKKTIINSNLTISELNRRYSEQTMSRLEGMYQVLTFYGDDIRKKKNVV